MSSNKAIGTEENKKEVAEDVNLFISPIDNPRMDENVIQDAPKVEQGISVQNIQFERGGSKSNTQKQQNLPIAINKVSEADNSRAEEIRQEKKNEPFVKMKDKKIIVNVEEMEGEFKKKEKRLFAIKCNNIEEMKNLKKEVELMHPRSNIKKKLRPFKVCQNIGNFCFFSPDIDNKINELGVGIISYFKVLKVLIYCFFVISILNIPLYYVNITNNKEITSTSYRDVLFKTTIGNIASCI